MLKVVVGEDYFVFEEPMVVHTFLLLDLDEGEMFEWVLSVVHEMESNLLLNQ